MACYQCRSGREEYFNRPEDGKKTAGGLCRVCYERRVREMSEAEVDKLCKKERRVLRTEDDDELMREIEREECLDSALSDLTEWR